MNDLHAPIIPPHCAGCSPWVRRIPHPLTTIPIEQKLHESSCFKFPHLQRNGPLTDG
jgi:hypothetical protein